MKQNIFHVTVNANSIIQHVIQIKNGIIKHVNVMDIVSTDMTNTVATNAMSINYHNIKARDCYILQTVLLVIILLLIITIIYYHYAKHRSKLKNI